MTAVRPVRRRRARGRTAGTLSKAYAHCPMSLLATIIRLLVALALVWAGTAPARAADTFLDPEVAFKAELRVLDARSLELTIAVAPGYYLYREQFKFQAVGATLGTPVIPPGKVKFDDTFQKNVETHRDLVRVVLPVEKADAHWRIAATYQGCADQGLCYPPQQLTAEVSLAGFGGDGSVRVLAGREPGDLLAGTTPAPTQPATGIAGTTGLSTSNGDGARLDAALRSGRFWTIVGVFFIAGVLLSLTPCVLPMIPILSSIIVGHGAAVSRGRGLLLAASYSLGMALVYTAFGVAAGLAGEGLAAALQQPWVLGLFAAGLAALSLSMFGVYELRLPNALTSPLAAASQRMPAGRVAGVLAMGGVSALIVSPCVAAPLAGALVYLSQTRDVALGGSALFALAAGMSVPLLAVGASAGALLPRAGAWMNDVKRVFGVLLLAVAVWTVQPVVPAAAALALWGAWLLGASVALVVGAGAARRPVRYGLAVLAAAAGIVQWVGALSGATDPLRPLAVLTGHPASAAALPFVPVRNVAELDAALASAGRPVMLDFYADWCVSCKEMERFTFSDPAVQARLSGALLLKADGHRELRR